MSDHTTIQCKTESHNYIVEKVKTTLCLVNMGAGKVGLTYKSKFSGVKDGHVNGGPIEVDGNLNKKLNKSPKVELEISNYKNTGSYASMHIKITVSLLGNKTIYNQTLGGAYNASQTGWAVALNNAQSLSEQRASA